MTYTPSELPEQWRRDRHIETRLRGQHLELAATWGLFSPKDIDEGSDLLLRHLEVNPDDRCLDLGCGYGVLGLTVAKLAPRGHVTLVDKDFVAVEYSRKNARTNAVENTETLLSNGLSAVLDRRFDLIVSNVPAKVGKEMWHIMLEDSRRTLKPGGRIVVVTINGLRPFIKRAFTETFGSYKKLKQGKTYTVAMAVSGC